MKCPLEECLKCIPMAQAAYRSQAQTCVASTVGACHGSTQYINPTFCHLLLMNSGMDDFMESGTVEQEQVLDFSMLF